VWLFSFSHFRLLGEDLRCAVHWTKGEVQLEQQWWINDINAVQGSLLLCECLV